MSTGSAATNAAVIHSGFVDGTGGMRPARWRPSTRPAPLIGAGTASEPDCDVVVVGGGPAGAAAAARLAAQGFATIVVDRAAFPRDKACGDFVGPAALAELADLGVSLTRAFAATNRIGE